MVKFPDFPALGRTPGFEPESGAAQFAAPDPVTSRSLQYDDALRKYGPDAARIGEQVLRVRAEDKKIARELKDLAARYPEAEIPHRDDVRALQRGPYVFRGEDIDPNNPFTDVERNDDKERQPGKIRMPRPPGGGPRNPG